MKITLDKNDEQIELLKAMASRDKTVAAEAQQLFAAYMGPVLSAAAEQAPILGNLYTTTTYDSNEAPSLRTDLFYDISDEKFITIHSQTAAGGLGTNEVVPVISEMFVRTYELYTALSFDRRMLAKSPNLDFVGRTMTKALQSILTQQENMSVGPIMAVLAAASTNGKQHVFRSAVAGRLLPDDFNALITLSKRIYTSYMGGTPVGARGRTTDLFLSPEKMALLREMAYQPINTKTAPQGSAIKDGLAAPDKVREALWGAADIATFYGQAIHEFNEFGLNQRFNTVFDVAAGSTNYSQADGSTGSAAFDGAATELILGVDRSRASNSLIRLAEVDAEVGSEFVFEVDNQFDTASSRTKKIGYFGGLTEGRIIIDNRVLTGLII
jgi:hypothetical protein